MSGRHRPRGPLGRGGTRLPLALSGVAVLVAVAVITVRIVAADAAGCNGKLALSVVATPEIAPVIEEVGASWTATKPRVNGQCIELSVDSAPAAVVASRLTVYAGRAIDVAAKPEPTPSEESLPTVWVPDSTAWLTRVQTVDRSAFDPGARAIASSPVVVAMPEAAARQVGWPARGLQVSTLKPILSAGGLHLGIAEPRRETASLAATMVLGEALATSDEDLPQLVKTFRSVVQLSSTAELLRSFGPRVTAGPASEQAVLAYNAGNPPLKLVPVPFEPAAPRLDYPFAIRAGLPREAAQAAVLFRTALLDKAAQELLARRAFRGPDGDVGAGFPVAGTSRSTIAGPAVNDRAKVQYALGMWAAANSPSRTLAMFDVTSSMGQTMPTQKGPRTRAQVMAEAAQTGLQLFTADSHVGMWAFSAQHVEVLPIDALSAERTALFNARMATATPGPTNASPLYDTLLAAYKVMKDGYDPTRPNIIVVLTDGGDSSAGGLRLEKFKVELQQLADATKPIRVVLIGVGVDAAGEADLRSIADAVGGGYFKLETPEQIQTIFLKALLRVGAA